MKLLLFMVVLLSSTAVIADEGLRNQDINNQPFEKVFNKPSKYASKCDANSIVATLDAKENLERRGCCSWHGGVCGCSDGRVVCCDNTLSPSCGC